MMADDDNKPDDDGQTFEPLADVLERVFANISKMVADRKNEQPEVKDP